MERKEGGEEEKWRGRKTGKRRNGEWRVGSEESGMRKTKEGGEQREPT